MKHILILVMIICMALFVGAQGEYTDDINDDPTEVKETYIPEVEPEPVPVVSRLNVTLIDDIGDQTLKLENAVIQLVGELHIAGDSLTYSDIFAEGDTYDVTIWIKRR